MIYGCLCLCEFKIDWIKSLLFTGFTFYPNWNYFRIFVFFFFFTHFSTYPPAPTFELGVFCFIICLDSAYKRDRMVLVFLWFISLSIMPWRSIHVVADSKTSFLFFFLSFFSKMSFFLWLNNIPLCVYNHSFFIHLSFFSFWDMTLLFLAGLGLCRVQAFSHCGEQGLLFVVVGGLLVAVASLDAEHRI